MNFFKNKLESGVIKYKPAILWFTGISGAGKTSIALSIKRKLDKLECKSVILDGDYLRDGLCEDLGFDDASRMENIRRISEVSRMFLESGFVVIVSTISPFIKKRQEVRRMFYDKSFFEIYIQCPIEICQKRDVKDLYKEVENGNIKQFTGLDSDYEPPKNADLVLNTDRELIDESSMKIIDMLTLENIIQLKGI